MAESEACSEGTDMKSNGHNGKPAEKMKRLAVLLWHKIWEVGREDPRRVIHSLKVGLALTLVSFLYLMEPIFKGIGQNAMWAVMTVVVVLEFTAGATLYKGLNRGFGTLCASSLAFFVEFIADKSGKVFHAVFIGFSVFVIGFTATYLRFIPCIKKNYDYGVVIFLLTFNLITVSSYRVHNVLLIAKVRLYTIAIGCGLCLIMSLLIFPNWAGEELHNSTVTKLEGLARSVEACVNKYFKDAEIEVTRCNSSKDPIYKDCRAVLDSKSNDESLALFASWEPRRFRHCYRHPWQQYVKLGAALRHFGYTTMALHGCVESEVQTPRSIRAIFKNPCIRLAGEVAKVLLELAGRLKDRRCCSHDILSDNLHEALQELNDAIKAQPRLFLGSNHGETHDVLRVAAAAAQQKPNMESGISLSSVKTDTSALLEFQNKRDTDHHSKDSDRKALRPTLSKIVITTSLEFSEALPFAAFASLLVEMAVRLELVIEEVEELEKVACFKFQEKPNVDIIVTCKKNVPESPHLPSQAAE